VRLLSFASCFALRHLGAKHWLETSARKPEMFVAVDISSSDVWYCALRITQFDYSKARPHEERLSHPLLQTALATVALAVALTTH
jgi:hypothetical protein